MNTRSPLSAKDLVDEYFIENRTRILEIAAFLDRLDRADAAYPAQDFRMRAFADALAAPTASRSSSATRRRSRFRRWTGRVRWGRGVEKPETC
jgi:hypothetical protein